MQAPAVLRSRVDVRGPNRRLRRWTPRGVLHSGRLKLEQRCCEALILRR